MHRVETDALTLGASSGNEVVVRARGVAGRHIRLFEKNGRYHLDLFKGVGAVSLNGQEFTGGAVTPGDRITIGEATITILGGARTPLRPTPINDFAFTDSVAVPIALPPTTEVEYRGMRLSVYRMCREVASAEELATKLVDFLDEELDPTEWAIGAVSVTGAFRALASTFLERPAIPPRLLEDYRAGERIVRSETVTGVLTLIGEPPRPQIDSFAILVRETPRLPARAVLFLEELVSVAGIAVARELAASESAALAPRPEPAVGKVPIPSTGAEIALRETDDLKRIIDTVEREVIDRTMRRAEGNQSRAAEVLNISRGSLIAKLKEYQIPDYRYLRRERPKKN
ncbi:MAG TPA: helix-turn-helix domain-containing protein [Thermoanaerobaculia bacterium]